jgi:DNA-binding transcriptional regulator YiaG
MVEWLTSSGLFNDPCDLCRVLRLDHDDELMGHGWHASDSETITEPELQARIRTLMRELRGEYDAPLPPPAERRRIREAAGWTQQHVADELHLSRHTVAKFERRAGWRNGTRLQGREPSGDVRIAYSELLKRLLVGDG